MDHEVKNGALVLWHRTANTVAILQEGFVAARQRFITEAGDDLGIAGVYVSDRPLDCNEGAARGTDPRRTMLLRVLLNLSEEKIDKYEIKDEAGTYREWCLPAAMLNASASLTIWDEDSDAPAPGEAQE